MFNPFREPVMQAVLKNLQRCCAKGTAELYVIYYDPVLGAMLDAAPFLTRIKTTRDYCIYRGAPQELRLDMTKRETDNCSSASG
jgi:hypothetical protein